MPNKEKRTWCYVQQPPAYEVAPCSCGNSKTQWSEYMGHLWCDKCEKDFIPAHGGIFDGPIPIELASMMGISFDRFDIATQTISRFDKPTGEYFPSTETSKKIMPDITDTRYPYTYACDYIRGLAGNDENGTKLSRSDASQIRMGIAAALGIDDAELACKLADRFKANDAEIEITPTPKVALKSFKP